MELSTKNFERYVKAMATKAELLLAFDVTSEELEQWCQRNYGCTYGEREATMHSSTLLEIRAQMFELARSGNPAMIALLAKQYLAIGAKTQEEEDEATKAMSRLNDFLSAPML